MADQIVVLDKSKVAYDHLAARSMARVIRKRLTALGLGADDLAGRMGLENDILERLETAHEIPSPAVLAAAARVLDIPLRRFFEFHIPEVEADFPGTPVEDSARDEGSLLMRRETAKLIQSFHRIQKAQDRERVLKAAQEAAEDHNADQP